MRFILWGGYFTRILHAVDDFSITYPFVNMGMAIVTFFIYSKGGASKALSLCTGELFKQVSNFKYRVR